VRTLSAAPLLAVFVALAATLAPNPAPAADAIQQCRDFFAKFEKCVDGLEGEQQEEARIFMRTLRGTVGMSDDLNRGDPMLTGMMCGFVMDEAKKDSSVQKYNCAW
jgi:hypothetical protein